MHLLRGIYFLYSDKTSYLCIIFTTRSSMTKRIITSLLWLYALSLSAQTYSLSELRQMALDNNKQLRVAQIQEDIASDAVREARTKSLPHVNALAGYDLFSREISLLNNHQKSSLSNLGSNAVGTVDGRISNAISDMVEQGVITADEASELSQIVQQLGAPIAEKGDAVGQSIERAFRTNTRNVFAGSVMVTQPIYAGGAITAANEMARISQQMASNNSDNLRRNTLLAIDNAYWMAVSLKNKEDLANDFLTLVKKLSDDVHKYIREGVATRADGLKVDVAVNEAEMAVTRVEDGVTLTKMYLCQLCGLPLNSDITLADEERGAWSEERGVVSEATLYNDSLHFNRPELRLLENAIELSKQTTKLTQALYRPHVALTGGVIISNPSLYNGFEHKFKENWNIGVLVQMPIWSWHEGRYKARMSRNATHIAELELEDTREKISLQVEQCRFKLKEACKRLNKATHNMQSAEENLRCANVGFREGVMTVTNVMEAQTAWQKAESQRIDARIDVIMAETALKHAVGESSAYSAYSKYSE